MRNYIVDGGGLGWYIIRAKTKKEARSHGIAEYGRGNVMEIRVATDQDTEYYMSVKGLSEIEEAN